MAQLAISLFGPPRVEVESQQIEIGRRKAIALLAYLATTGQSHNRAALAALLWPEASPPRAGASLRSALWTLNKTPLQAWLYADAEVIALETDAKAEVDVVRFQELLATPQQHNHPLTELCDDCLEPVGDAVALYKDNFMAGFTVSDAPAFDEWQFFQANSYRELLVTALKQLLRFFSAAGDFDRAISYGRRFAALDPLHEPGHHALMQLYARSGRKAAALRQYEVYREMLATELGVEPSTDLTALTAQIRSDAWPERKTQYAKIIRPQQANVPPHNLPPDRTPFIGREHELRRIVAFLDDPGARLITIVGPGGIGKTRLALATSAAMLSKSSFADGIYFVPLAPVATPEAMLSLIAETVGYPLQSDLRNSAQQLFDYFRQKSMLLVLDNFEHLLRGAIFIADLLQQAPHVTVLVTSRQRLNLYEEQQYLLHGLAIPETKTAVSSSDYPAAVLFVQSARRRRPDFEVELSDLPHLATICRLVEGMPLGLELAAAWTEILPLRQIAAEIRKNLDFLETAIGNMPQRHRSMRAVFDASWRRLSETEQRIYAQLSVFRGGFTAAAAKAVTGASLKTLLSLVKQSLLRPSPEVGRYDIHELLRQYAAVKLQESDDGEKPLNDRHAAYYCAFLQEREADLKGGRQQAVLAEIEADLENANAAWRWSVTQQHVLQLEQALISLALFYHWHGRLREGQAMCRLAVDQLIQSENSDDEASRSHLLLKLLTWQSLFELGSANYESAERSLQRARAILEAPTLRDKDTKADKAFLLLQLSEAAKRKAFRGDALTLLEQSLALYRSIDDAWGITQALDALGARHWGLGNYDLAIQLQRECLAICEKRSDPRGIARAYTYLGHYMLFAGQLEASEPYLRKSLALFQKLNNRADQRLPLLMLGANLIFAGKFEESITSYEACWAIHRELGMPHEPASANVSIARAKINLGLYEEARRLAEADLVRYRGLKLKWYLAYTLFNLGRIALVEEDVTQAHERFQECAVLLLEMDDRPLVPDVLLCQAFVYRRLGNRQQAIHSIIKALKIAFDGTPVKPMRFELPAMALLLLDAGETARAVELYAAAQQSPYIANSIWFDAIAGQEIAQAAATLPPDVAAAAEARGRERDLLVRAEALLAELVSTASD